MVKSDVELQIARLQLLLLLLDAIELLLELPVRSFPLVELDTAMMFPMAQSPTQTYGGKCGAGCCGRQDNE